MISNSGDHPYTVDGFQSCVKYFNLHANLIDHLHNYNNNNYNSDSTYNSSAGGSLGGEVGGSFPRLYPYNISYYTLTSQYHDSHLHYVYLVGFPVFITVGVLANLLDLWVLAQPSMQGIAFRYLARLALSDLLYLIFNIPFCLEDFALTTDGLLVSESSAFYYAYIAVPIVNFFLTLSVYIIVWLSYDRWLAVCSPHKFPTKQTLLVVHRRCLATILVTFVMYVPSPLRQTYSCTEVRDDIQSAPSQVMTRVGCCVYESQYMKQNWFYFYEFIREIYSRFLPGVLITAFNVAIIATLRLAKRGKKMQMKNSNPVRMGIIPPPINAIQNDNKSSDDNGAREICSEVQYDSLNCCRDVTSPVPFERIELRKVTGGGVAEKDVSSVGCGSNTAQKAEGSDGVTEKGSDLPIREPERIVRPCSIIPISPERSTNSIGGSKPKGKTRYVVVNETRNDREVCLVLLLLAITVFFYISSFPSALYKLMPSVGNEEEKIYDVFRAVADVLEVSGHVFNFCLYFLLSPEFRRTLFSLLPFLSRIHSIAHNL